MKRTITITVIIALLTVFSANAQKAMDKFMVQVDGLGCPFCAYGLEKKFKEFKGIKGVKIDIETGDFSFRYPAEKMLTMTDVEKQVEKAGYTPITSRIERADGTIEASKSVESTTENDGAQLISKDVFVAGKCGMCEARILKAAKSVAGTEQVTWDVDTKIMSVKFDSKRTSMSDIEKAVSASGHDTKKHRADDAKYENLPACCHYERVTK